VSPRPYGIAQVFLLSQQTIDGGKVVLAPGDNIFYGHGVPELPQRAAQREAGRARDFGEA